MTRDTAVSLYLFATKLFIWASFASPLVLSSFFYFPYIVPKTIFFQVAVELALFFWIVLCVLDQKYRPKFDILSVAISVFFAVYVIAGALGANPLRSFFGTYERMLSVINLAHFIAFFFITRSVFSTVGDWLVLFRAFVGVSVAVSLYAAAQKLGWGALVYHAGIDRLDSTIGNAAFVAGYLMFAVFFAAFLLLKDRHAGFRAFASFSVVLNIAVMYFTGTRGAALAMMGAVALLAAAYLMRPRTAGSISARSLGLGVSAVALLAAAVIVLGGQEGAGAVSYLKRFTSVSLSDTTVQTRILSVQTSMEGFWERPVLGWGPENYNLVFDRYYNPKLYPTENWFDHAHNIVFDIVTATGIVGAAAYVFLIGTLLVACMRCARASPESYWIGIFSAALLAAYVAQNFFVFDSLVTYLPFFLFAAFAANGFPLREENKNATQRERAKQFYNPSARVAVALIPVFCVVMWTVNIRPAVAAYFTVAALSTNPAHADEAVAYFDRSLAWGNFGAHEIRGKLANYAADYLASDQFTDDAAKKNFAQFTVAEMEKNLTEQPLDFRNYLYYASFLSGQAARLAEYGVPDPLARADAVLAQARELGPHKPILHLQWAQIKSARGDFAGAAQLLQEAAALRPDLPEFPLRTANAYQRMGDNAKAAETYRAVWDGFASQLDAQQLIDLAVGFANNGDKDRAIQAAHKAVERNPDLRKGAEEFIRKVQELK